MDSNLIAQEEDPPEVSDGEELTPEEEEMEAIAVVIEEQLMCLNADGLAELAKTLKIRRGRLKTKDGLKSKFQLRREVRKSIDGICSAGTREGLQLLKTVRREIASLKGDTFFRSAAANAFDDEMSKDEESETVDGREHVTNQSAEDNSASELEPEGLNAREQVHAHQPAEEVTKKAQEMLEQMLVMQQQLKSLVVKSGSDREKEPEETRADKKKQMATDEDTDTELFCPQTRSNRFAKESSDHVFRESSESASEAGKFRKRNETLTKRDSRCISYPVTTRSKRVSDQYHIYSSSEHTESEKDTQRGILSKKSMKSKERTYERYLKDVPSYKDKERYRESSSASDCQKGKEKGSRRDSRRSMSAKMEVKEKLYDLKDKERHKSCRDSSSASEEYHTEFKEEKYRRNSKGITSSRDEVKRRPSCIEEEKRKEMESFSASDYQKDHKFCEKGGARKKNQNDIGDRISIRDLKEVWRKELKIKGQIGKVGDKDKLDYASLKRQVDGFKARGSPESDIIEAVLNATTAGSDIRALLQSMRDLSVKSLMEILQS